MEGPDQGLVFKCGLWQSLVKAQWQRSLDQTLGKRVIRMAGSPQVLVYVAVLLTLKQKGWHGGQGS